MRKITVLLPYANPHVIGWIEILSDNFHVDIYCSHPVSYFRDGYFEKYDNISKINYRFKNKNYHNDLRKSVKKSSFILSLGIFNFDFLYSLIFSNKKIIYVMSEPFNPINSKNKFIFRYIYSYVLRSLNKKINFLCIGGKDVKYYYQKLGFIKSNFYNFGYFPKLDKKLKNKKAFKSSKLSFVFVGQLIARKRIDILIRYLSYLNHNYKGKFTFNIIGDGFLKNKLIKNIKQYNNPDIIHHGLIDDNRKIDKIYSDSQILFICSDFDGWGAVVNEALNHSLLILSSRFVYSSKFLVRPMFNGFIFDNNKVEELFTFSDKIFSKKINLSQFRYNSSIIYEEWNNKNACDSFINLINNIKQNNSSLLNEI